MKKKLSGLLARHGRQAAMLGLGLLLFGLIYLPRLGGLTPGDNGYEQPAYLGILHKHDIIVDSSFAPVKVVQFLMLKIDTPNATLLRLVSAGVVLVALLAFYLLVNKWHTRRVAILSTSLFATSSYMLHLGRLANDQVLYLCVIPVLLLMGTWLKSKKHVRKLPLATLLAALLLYTPGAWILLLGVCILFRKRLILAWKFVGKNGKIASSVIGFLTISPLLYSFARYPDQIKTWLGLNAAHMLSTSTSFHQLKAIPNQLFVHGPTNSAFWLHGTPILDVFTIGMASLGIYAYTRGHHPLRARLLTACSVVALSLFVLGGPVTIALFIPIIYLLAAAGIARLLQTWFTVFPRNPFARNTAVVLLAAVICLTSFYHLKRYYVAWPNSPATKQAFKVSPPPKE